MIRAVRFSFSYRFEDELVVVGEVEDGTRGPGIAQLTHRLVAEAHLKNMSDVFIHKITKMLHMQSRSYRLFIRHV